MTALTLLATGRLTASLEDRVITGMLLPYNEEGRTNLGRLTASADSALTLADLVPLNVEHKPQDVIGKAVTVEAGADGLHASFKVLETPAGDAALLEVAEGLRASLSVEVDPVVTRGGRIVSGTVTGAALVAKPAFAGAKLNAAEDSPVPDTDDDGAIEFQTKYTGGQTPAVVIDSEPLANVEKVTVSESEITITTTKTEAPAEDDTKEPAMTAARVQNAALLGATKPKNDSNALFAALAGGFGAGLSGGRLEAALSDVVPANILGIEQPQYVGELWNGQPFERRIIPQFDHSDLNSFNIKGWEWGTEPTVGLYTGNKTEIPSAAINTVEKSGTLQRIAGGHDIDRKFRDFSNAEFWEAYFRKMAESYAKVSDNYIRSQVVASIGAGTQRQHLAPGAMPAGVPAALAMIVKASIKMLDDLNTLPTVAFVTSDFWEPLFYVQQQQVLAYLTTSLGLKEGDVEGFKIVPVPTGSLTAGAWVGKVVVAHKSAFNVYELPGSPIRVSTEDLAKGGVDEALFGYCGYMLENAKGLISYDTPS